MRLAFFGTPDDAVPPLRALQDAGHDIAVVVTQPDRRRARLGPAAPSPVKAAALDLNLAVRTPERAREVSDELRELEVEIGVVVGFGQLLPDALLATAPLGFVNLHFSVLPRWRGAAPVERAILAGDTETGVAVMRIEASLDTGPIYAQRRVPIIPDETAGELRARLVEIGTDVLVETLPRVAATEPTPQRGEATYADKLTVGEFRINWERPAAELVRVVRAGNPRPGAWTMVDGHRLKVWRAHAEDDRFVPDTVQPEGGRTMPADAWRAGLRGREPVFE